MLTAIPCMLMRGGTSKGPFFLASDLPCDPAQRERVLLAAMGSPDSRQIDGLGGGDPLTSKVMIVSPSREPGMDVDHLFAQVSVEEARVDTSPACGNMLAGVGPFAIERGLVPATDPLTTVRIRNVTTGRIVEAVVRTAGGRVVYDGDTRIDGVPGSGAPILLNFLDAAGGKTGSLLPTGRPIDVIDGVPVSCIDFANPLVLLAAASVGKTGYETKQALDADAAMLARLEAIRRAAARLMGLGDVSGRVLPKLALLARPRAGGSICSRYFVPSTCHAAHAATGALCVAAACVLPGTVAASLAKAATGDEPLIAVEHPSGKIEARLQLEPASGSHTRRIRAAGIVRTARPIFSGAVLVPGTAWREAA